MKTIHFLWLLIFTLGSLAASAQQQIMIMSVDPNPSAADTTIYGVPIIDSLTTFNPIMRIIVGDDESINQLHVKLGSTCGGSDYLSTSFEYGVTGTFGNMSYSQNNNLVILGLGTQIGMVHFFAEVQVEKNDHSTGTTLTFSNY